MMLSPGIRPGSTLLLCEPDVLERGIPSFADKRSKQLPVGSRTHPLLIAPDVQYRTLPLQPLQPLQELLLRSLLDRRAFLPGCGSPRLDLHPYIGCLVARPTGEEVAKGHRLRHAELGL